MPTQPPESGKEPISGERVDPLEITQPSLEIVRVQQKTVDEVCLKEFTAITDRLLADPEAHPDDLFHSHEWLEAYSRVDKMKAAEVIRDVLRKHDYPHLKI